MDRRLFLAEEGEKRLDVFLSERLEDLTRSRIKKLIDTGNLPHHVLWEDKLVARRGLEVSPEELGHPAPKLGKCPNCGANMTERGCEYCGYRA